MKLDLRRNSWAAEPVFYVVRVVHFHGGIGSFRVYFFRRPSDSDGGADIYVARFWHFTRWIPDVSCKWLWTIEEQTSEAEMTPTGKCLASYSIDRRVESSGRAKWRRRPHPWQSNGTNPYLMVFDSQIYTCWRKLTKENFIRFKFLRQDLYHSERKGNSAWPYLEVRELWPRPPAKTDQNTCRKPQRKYFILHQSRRLFIKQ